MKVALIAILVVSILAVGLMSSPIYAEPITKKYYTQPFWIYQIEIEYTGDKQFYVFWNDKRINVLTPDENSNTSEMEVYATSNETVLDIYDSGDLNNLSANVRILDVSEIRPMTSDEIKTAKAVIVEDPRDKKILELEARVQTLENEKFNLEKEVTRLNRIVDTLQDELKQLTDEFVIAIQNQFNWFQDKIGN